MTRPGNNPVSLNPLLMVLFSAAILLVLAPFEGRILAQKHTAKQEADSMQIIRLDEKFKMHLKGNQFIAAETIADSMMHIAENANLLSMIGRSYFRFAQIEHAKGNTGEFIRNLENAIDWYKRAGARKSAARAYTLIGQTLTGENYQLALQNFMASLELRIKEKDSLGICNNLINIGGVYYQMGRYSEANHYLYQALQLSGQLSNNTLKAYAMLNLSHIHNKLKNFDVSHDYLQQALKIHRDAGNRQDELKTLMAIGNTYFEQGKLTDAESYYLQSLKIANTAKNAGQGYLPPYNNLGLIAKNRGDTIRAIDYFNQAIESARKTNDKNALSIALSNLSSLTKTTDEELALSQIMSSLKSAEELGVRRMILVNYENLMNYYGERNDYKTAFEYSTKYQKLYDSIYSDENAIAILNLQNRFEKAEKEKEIALMKKEKLERELQLSKANSLKIIALFTSVLLLFLLISLYVRYLNRQRVQTELAIINDKLNRLNSTKDKLFSIVSHDLKNSMNGFSQIVNTLNKNYDNFSADDIRYYIDEVSGSANATKELLKNLLDWARSQRDLIEIKPVKVDIPEVIRKCEVQINQQLKRKQLRFEVDCPETLSVTTDADILTTAIRNIMVNAVKYSHENGRIEVKAGAENGQVRIDISDEGIGIEPEMVEEMMQPGTFVKSRPGVNGEKGAGLGLLLTRELLEKISGRLLVQSERMKGSTFSILIPA